MTHPVCGQGLNPKNRSSLPLQRSRFKWKRLLYLAAKAYIGETEETLEWKNIW